MRKENDPLSEKVIGCAFSVSNSLGAGFLESVYENALVHELRKNGIVAEKQKRINVKYDNVIVGEFVADILVDNELIVELKAVKAFDNTHIAQCINYLKATGLEACLLLNFGTSKIGIRRICLEQ